MRWLLRALLTTDAATRCEQSTESVATASERFRLGHRDDFVDAMLRFRGSREFLFRDSKTRSSFRRLSVGSAIRAPAQTAACTWLVVKRGPIYEKRRVREIVAGS